MRSVPLTYGELVAAIENGVFPWERTWIDFKRRLYPESSHTADGAARAKVSMELAKDMASMAPLGGYLVYGVREDKAGHGFEVDEMELPVGLHETVDAVARDRITPSLTVIPTPVPNPEIKTIGFLVVQVPPSPDSPHMADSIYWGRSETGKVRLSDDHVERMILARNRLSERLADAMKATVQADPIRQGHGCHFYFTAVPTLGYRDMFADYARDRVSRIKLMQKCTGMASQFRSMDPAQRPGSIAFDGMINDRRSQWIPAGWLYTWSGDARDGHGRLLGVDDDGPIRFIDLSAHSYLSADNSIHVVCDAQLLHETRDMIRLIASLADEISYPGGWFLGVEMNRLRGHMSQMNDPFRGGWAVGAGLTFDSSEYAQTTKATGLEIREKGEVITGRLVRQLLRGLGTEALLDQPPFGRAQTS
jgi:hypothetical protein